MPDKINLAGLSLLLAATTASVFSNPFAAAASDIVPLTRGYYVVADAPCGEASNASLDLFLGHAFRATCRTNKVTKVDTSYVVASVCVDRGESEKVLASYQIISRTEYIVTYLPSGKGDRSSTRHFRYCPQSTLPEPWRSNDIGLTRTEPSAQRISLDRGEGGVGLDAVIALDDSGMLATRLIGCRRGPGRLKVQLGLFCRSEGKLPSELESICDKSDDNAKLPLSVCINDRCEERKWQFFQSGFGDAFFTDEVIKQPQRVTALRIVVPGETARYEFRGDLTPTLRKICR